MKAFLQSLLFIWQLPQNLVALIMMLFIGKLTMVGKTDWCTCYRGSNMSGGISLGSFAFVSPYLFNSPEAIAHEMLGHTKQSRILGPLYLLVIGLPSLIHAWVHNPFKSCYYDFYTESNANKNAGLTVNENCRLVFKD